MRDIEGIDEILQIMYWMQAESLMPDVSAADLVRFLDWPLARLEQVLAQMAESGLVAVQGFTADAPRFILTGDGQREGARRFSDEFAAMTRPGHGQCGDAECECHMTGSAEDCRHRG